MPSLFQSLRPLLYFEFTLMVILTLITYWFRNSTKFMLYGNRWPVQCGPGGFDCHCAMHEYVVYLSFDEHLYIMVIAVTHAFTTLLQLFSCHEKYDEALNTLHLFISFGLTLPYISYVLGVREILTFYLMVVYCLVMTSMITLHDTMYRRGTISPTLLRFSYAVDTFLWQGFLANGFIFIFLEINGGHVEVYSVVVLCLALLYAFIARAVRYVFFYCLMPQTVMDVMKFNGMEANTIEDLSGIKGYKVVTEVNPEMSIRMLFYIRLGHLMFIFLLVVTYIAFCNDSVQEYVI